MQPVGWQLLLSLLAFLSVWVASRIGRRLFQGCLWGQMVRDDGPASHLSKQRTPTSGGILWLLGLWPALLYPSMSVGYCMAVTGLFGLIGFLDDMKKYRGSSHRGLSGRKRLLLEGLVGSFALYSWQRVHPETQVIIPLWGAWHVPGILWVVWGAFVLVSIANATNLTDGLDGLLSTQVLIIAAGLLCLVARVDHSLVCWLSVVLGATAGFLWVNAYPAQWFMGDVGSLSMGAAIAMPALLVHQEIALAFMGWWLVAETLSVMIQVGYFKFTGGKRVFRMAPLHHHFELAGVHENQIVYRTGILSAWVALGVVACQWSF